jgi:hypothetical protein
VTPIEPRLMTLFLRSRQASPTLLTLVGVAAATGLAFALITSAELALLVRSVGPLAAAVVVGVAVRSPFGETERLASAALALLRAGHVAGLVVVAAIGLGIGGALWRPAGISIEDAVTILTRNLAGFAGLALIAAVLIGGGLSWLAPLGFGGGTMMAHLVGIADDAWWYWPVQDADDGSARFVATALLVVGIVALSRMGARDVMEDGS